MLGCSDDEILQVHKIIGANVKKMRKSRSVTQIELALALGFKTVSSVAKAEICAYSHWTWGANGYFTMRYFAR